MPSARSAAAINLRLEARTIGFGAAQLFLGLRLRSLRGVELLGGSSGQFREVLEAARSNMDLLLRRGHLDPRWLASEERHLRGADLLLQDHGHGLAACQLATARRRQRLQKGGNDASGLLAARDLD